MKHLAAALALLALAAGAGAEARPAPRDGGERDRPSHGRAYANPSAIITAELALSRLAREKGENAALLETAAPEAEIYTPERVAAQAWLKGRESPSEPGQWDVHQVWMSCDGSYAVALGGWTRGNSAGRLVSVWQRQPKHGYRWLLRLEVPLAQPLVAPEFLTALVADCDGTPPAAPEGTARSGDSTLRWLAPADASGTMAIRWWKDGVLFNIIVTP